MSGERHCSKLSLPTEHSQRAARRGSDLLQSLKDLLGNDGRVCLAPIFADTLDDETSSLILGDLDPEPLARRGKLLVEARRVRRREQAIPDMTRVLLSESGRVRDESVVEEGSAETRRAGEAPLAPQRRDSSSPGRHSRAASE